MEVNSVVEDENPGEIIQKAGHTVKSKLRKSSTEKEIKWLKLLKKRRHKIATSRSDEEVDGQNLPNAIGGKNSRKKAKRRAKELEEEKVEVNPDIKTPPSREASPVTVQAARKYEYDRHPKNQFILFSKKTSPMLVYITTMNVKVNPKLYKKSKAVLQNPFILEQYSEMRAENSDLKKYFRRCCVLFSKFGDGIKLDYESWYSVTPEPIAKHIASRLAGHVILDGFCGAGGNVIQFGLVAPYVIGNDIDEVKINCAKHNAGIYGVQDNIDFIQSDFLELSNETKPLADGKYQIDTVFVSPPWGGTTYLNDNKFHLRKSITPDIIEIITKCLELGKNIVLLLPRSTPIIEIVKAFGDARKKYDAKLGTNVQYKQWSIEVEGICWHDELSMLAVYFGDVASFKIKDEKQYVNTLFFPEELKLPKEIKQAQQSFVKKMINEKGLVEVLEIYVRARKILEHEKQAKKQNGDTKSGEEVFPVNPLFNIAQGLFTDGCLQAIQHPEEENHEKHML